MQDEKHQLHEVSAQVSRTPGTGQVDRRAQVSPQSKPRPRRKHVAGTPEQAGVSQAQMAPSDSGHQNAARIRSRGHRRQAAQPMGVRDSAQL